MKLMIEVKYVGHKFRARVYEWRVDRYNSESEPDWYVYSFGYFDHEKAEWSRRTPEKAYEVAEKFVENLQRRERLDEVRRAFEDGVSFELEIG